MTAEESRLRAQLKSMTVERDNWKTNARRYRNQRQDDARHEFMTELAKYVVTEMRAAGFIQINPNGVPTDDN